MLNYREPQILELCKNTLPSRLYYILYPTDELRAAVQMAKRVLTKEKIHKQIRGQSSASPFMKANQESKKNCGNGVSFGALETTERNRDSIDKIKIFCKQNGHENRRNPVQTKNISG